MAPPIGKTQPKLNARMYAMLLSALVLRPRSVASLCDETGLHRDTVMRVINALKARELAHVSSWERDTLGRPAFPVYSFGAGIDARKPVKTKQEVNRDFKLRQLARQAASGEGAVYISGVAA